MARTKANCNFWTGLTSRAQRFVMKSNWAITDVVQASSDRVLLHSTPSPLRQHRPVRINSPLRDLWFPLSGPAASTLFWPELWWWFMSCKWLLKSGPTHTFHCNSLFSYWSPCFFFCFFFWLGFKKSVLCKKVNRSLWKKSLTHTQTHTAHPCACTQIHNLHSTHMPAAYWHNTPGSKPFVNCATVHHEAITQSINWSPEIKRKWYSITDGGKTTNIRLSVLLKDLHGFLYVCVFWMNIDVITCDRHVMFIV